MWSKFTQSGRFFGSERYFNRNRLTPLAKSSQPRKVNQFRVKVPKEGTTLRSGRMQVRRKSECLKESQREESAHLCDRKREREREQNIGKGKLDEVRFSKRRLFFPGHWTVQSFRKSRLLRNYGLAASSIRCLFFVFVKPVVFHLGTGANNTLEDE